uniref:Uncharacterized protein n=1 Tax=Anopheles dirus TaxID=7168 RepID=A0A182N9W2_9DIPT
MLALASCRKTGTSRPCILAARVNPSFEVTVTARWNSPKANTCRLRGRILPPSLRACNSFGALSSGTSGRIVIRLNSSVARAFSCSPPSIVRMSLNESYAVWQQISCLLSKSRSSTGFTGLSRSQRACSDRSGCLYSQRADPLVIALQYAMSVVTSTFSIRISSFGLHPSAMSVEEEQLPVKFTDSLGSSANMITRTPIRCSSSISSSSSLLRNRNTTVGGRNMYGKLLAACTYSSACSSIDFEP